MIRGRIYAAPSIAKTITIEFGHVLTTSSGAGRLSAVAPGAALKKSRRSRRSESIRFSLLTALALTLAACGDKGEDTGSSDGTEGADGTDGSDGTDGTDGGDTDNDGDGFVAGEDCDDSNPDINPGATEVCDGLDNDCNGEADEGVTSTFYGDADGDGYAGAALSVEACEAPDGFYADDDDCDDSNPDINPGATEVCDGDATDEDCSGDADDADAGVDLASQWTWYADVDTDGYGDMDDVGVMACAPPSGTVSDNTDCDDSAWGVNPGATEVCDEAGTDEDCSGDADDADVNVDSASTTGWYADVDLDGYGDMNDAGTWACAAPSGMVADHTDCDDANFDVNPGATEVCDEAGTDEDCNGAADDADSGVTGQSTLYLDYDGDGYGGSRRTAMACMQPAYYFSAATDCDDSDPSAYPGASDAWYDGVDSDCAGDNDYDADADGYESDAWGGTDCDDTDVAVNPGATETWYDGTDSDCSGGSDYDADMDGSDSDVYGGEDCDDTDSAIFPYAWEDDSDGIDNDCDGLADSLDTSLVTRLFSSGDDSSTAYTPTSLTWSFPFCGEEWTGFSVQTNGQIMFGGSHTDYSESVSEFLSDGPSVAPQWDDMYVYSGVGSIWAVEHADAIGIYYRDVSDCCGSSAGNELAAVLRDDGIIQMTIDSVYSSDGIVGWSCATDSGAAESNLSADIANQVAGTAGIGMGTEPAHYEHFTGSSDPVDLTGYTWRMCGNAGNDLDSDGWTDTCGDTNDNNSSVHP